MLNLSAEDLAPVEQAQTPPETGGWTVLPDAPAPQTTGTGGWTVVEDTPPPQQRFFGPKQREDLGKFASELHSVNPKDWNNFIQQAFWHPIDTAKGILSGHDALRLKAQNELKSGDVANGVRHFVEWVVPIATGVGGGVAGLAAGPVGAGAGLVGGYAGGAALMNRVDEAGDALARGDYPRGLGATVDAATMVALPKAAESAPQAVRAALPRFKGAPQPLQDAVQFGRERGIGPIDAATRADSPFLRHLEKAVGSTPGGYLAVEGAQARQAASLAKAGADLAEEYGPGAASTFGAAGDILRQAFGDRITAFGREADTQYAKVREAGGPPSAPVAAPPVDPNAPPTGAGEMQSDFWRGAAGEEGLTYDDMRHGMETATRTGAPDAITEPTPTTAVDIKAKERSISAALRPGFDKLIEDVRKPDGGFTYNVTADTEPADGFAVSVFKDKETTVPATAHVDELINRLAQFIGRNWDTLASEDYHVGGWNNPKDGQIYFDITRVVKDAETANRIGIEHQQRAYFDLANKTAHDVDYSVTSEGAHGIEGQEAGAVSGPGPQGRPDGRGPVPPRQADDGTGAVGGGQGQGGGNVGGGAGAPGGQGGEVGGPPPNMRAPVDLRPAKVALKPYYEQVLEQWPETQRAASPGFLALKRVVEGPDWRPADAVDQDLSLIKAIVREAPAMLRNRSQGLAAVAIGAIDPAVREAIFKAGGPEAAQALAKGREAVKGKYAAADVLRSLPKETARIVAKLMAPRDSNVLLLKKVAEQLPDKVQDVGRAWLQTELDTAGAEGGFNRADKLWADWNKLGPVTKQTVFGEHLQDVNNFFLLAKKLKENPNPSGTGATVMAGMSTVGAAQLGGWPGMLTFLLSDVGLPYGLAKLLYTDRGAKALVTVMKAQANIPVKPVVLEAAMASIVSETARIGQEVHALPKAAQEPEKQRPK